MKEWGRGDDEGDRSTLRTLEAVQELDEFYSAEKQVEEHGSVRCWFGKRRENYCSVSDMCLSSCLTHPVDCARNINIVGIIRVS